MSRNREKEKTEMNRKTVEPKYLDLESSSCRKSRKRASACALREYKRDKTSECAGDSEME